MLIEYAKNVKVENAKSTEKITKHQMTYMYNEQLSIIKL